MFQLTVILSLLVICASSISTVIGFGTGTLLMPFALALLPFNAAYIFVGFLQWLSGLWKTYLFWPQVHWRLVIRFGLPMTLGAFFGAAILFFLPPAILLRLFGLLLILYVLYLIKRPNFHLPRKGPIVIAVGIVLGFFGGLFGVRGPLRSAYLSAARLSNEKYICTSGVIGLCIDTVRIAVYVYGGMRLTTELSFLLLFLMPLSLGAAWYAQRFVRQLHQEKFRLLVAGMLFLIGVKFLFGI